MTKRSDSQIRNAVIHELKWDTRVDDAGIDVESSDGVVLLSGTVTSWPARLAAQAAAHRVTGVLDVANDIQVNIPRHTSRPDADIARAIRAALESSISVPETRIQTTVCEGVVTLQGQVDYWSQREDAEAAVQDVAGVRWVLNEITIQSAVPPADVILESIEQALARRAERKARKINVSVNDGKVVVSGAVHSWAERQSVVGAVRGTPGVRIVDDHLRIEA